MEELKVTDEGRKRSLKLWGGLILLVVIVAAPYFYRTARDRWQAAQTLQALEKYENLVKNDTYGGATPEETLKLFIAALREGNVEKASLYFTLDDTGSREKWLKYLQSVKDRNLLAQMASDIEKEAKRGKSLSQYDASFELFNPDRTVGVRIDLIFTGKVWKIESL